LNDVRTAVLFNEDVAISNHEWTETPPDNLMLPKVLVDPVAASLADCD